MARRIRLLVAVAAWGLILYAPAVKAADPAVIQAPVFKPHRFLDKQNITIFTIDAVAMAADLVTTRRALEVPGAHEANPLMQSPSGAIAIKFGALGAGVGITYMLHKSGHHRAERLVPIILGVPSAVAAAHNAGIHP